MIYENGKFTLKICVIDANMILLQHNLHNMQETLSIYADF